MFSKKPKPSNLEINYYQVPEKVVSKNYVEPFPFSKNCPVCGEETLKHLNTRSIEFNGAHMVDCDTCLSRVVMEDYYYSVAFIGDKS